jgi:glycopeptide antibiotics resistance protein
VIWILWRVAVWRRHGVDPVREAMVSVLFLYALAVVRVTLFPLNVVLYDWHGTTNLIPLASIIQLITETNSTVANINIVGNLVLFVPLGFLLPLLFERLRSFRPLLWRAAVISIVIEIAQIVTRARATDIDDVILNTTGAAIGYAIYGLAAAGLKRTVWGGASLDRLGAGPAREPLLGAAVPLAGSLAIAVPMMLSSLFAATLGSGADGIVGYATAERPGSTVVARADLPTHTFIVVRDSAATPEELVRYDFIRVMPGRYSWIGTADMPADGGSRYGWSITPFDISRNEIPVVVVWGSNQADASTVVVSGTGVEETLAVPPGLAFVVGFEFDVVADTGMADVLDDFTFQFLDGSGADVSEEFQPADR